jgi:hypothetical protein
MIEDITRGKGLALPEWIEPEERTPRTGGDLLGLKDLPRDMSARWLNGITENAKRIRYISLLTWYAHIYGQGICDEDLTRFKASHDRFEAVVAFANLHIDRRRFGMSGLNGAKTEYDAWVEGDEESLLIRKGFLDKSTGFATYNPCAQTLGLLTSRRGVAPRCTDLGRALAELMTREFKRRNVLSDVEELVSDGFLEITQDQLEVFADALDVEHIPPDERGFLLDLLIPTEQRLDELGGDLAERGDHIRRAGTCGLLLDLVEVCGANLKVEDGSVFVSPGKQSVS